MQIAVTFVYCSIESLVEAINPVVTKNYDIEYGD